MDAARVTLVGSIIANEASDDYVITLMELENTIWWGLTFGAWFKVGMALALFLLVIERIVNIYNKVRRKND